MRQEHMNPEDNAQNLYNGLANQYLELTNKMKQTFNSLATRVVDDRRAVKKIHGDPMDDLYDMIAYAYNTWMLESVKPERMKVQEKLEAMRKRGADATAIARQSLIETKRLADEERARAKGLPLRKR